MQIFNWILNLCFSEHSGTRWGPLGFRRMEDCAAGHAEGAGGCSWQIVFQGKAELVGRKASGENISGIAIHTWRITGILSDWELVLVFIFNGFYSTQEVFLLWLSLSPGWWSSLVQVLSWSAPLDWWFLRICFLLTSLLCHSCAMFDKQHSKWIMGDELGRLWHSMAISKAAVKSSLTPKHFKRQTMYKSCSFGSIQPRARPGPTKDSSDYWNSDSVFLVLIVYNSKSAPLPPPSPFSSRLYLLVCLGFLLETTRPQGLKTSESLFFRKKPFSS